MALFTTRPWFLTFTCSASEVKDGIDRIEQAYLLGAIFLQNSTRAGRHQRWRDLDAVDLFHMP